MSFRIIIPARYQASRLPGKPLADIKGKPLIQHVYERAKQSGATSVLIATDHEAIYQAAKKFGADVCLTAAHHRSGTERIAEVVVQQHYADDEIVVNVQGDEALIPPAIIKQVAENLHKNPQADMATLCEPIHTREELLNPNAVKVVCDQLGFALYFSRAPIPWDRDAHGKADYYRHVGLYAYRTGFIKQYVTWKPCALEQIEALEQLRVLWYGRKIHVAVANEAVPIDVNTPDDLERVRNLYQG